MNEIKSYTINELKEIIDIEAETSFKQIMNEIFKQIRFHVKRSNNHLTFNIIKSSYYKIDYDTFDLRNILYYLDLDKIVNYIKSVDEKYIIRIEHYQNSPSTPSKPSTLTISGWRD